MKFIKTDFADAWLIEPNYFADNRGAFMVPYEKREFEANGITGEFVQDNYSFSAPIGTLRGLHLQKPPFAQAKLVRVTRGAVYDVIVDIRKDSPTYLQWQGFELSAENRLMLYVPRGFLHGFVTRVENTEFTYKVDNFYSPAHEDGVIWNDAQLRIDWNISEPILSAKDERLGSLKNLLSQHQ